MAKAKQRRTSEPDPGEDPLPPIPERLVVKMGLAQALNYYTIRYNMDALKELWCAWPGTLRDFCRALQIPYKWAQSKASFAIRDRERDVEATARTFREAMASILATRPMIAGEDQGRRVRSVLDRIHDGGSLCVSYALAKLAKVQPDGSMEPNLHLKPGEVRTLSDILLRAAAAIRDTVEMEKLAQDAATANAARVTPRPVVATVEARVLPASDKVPA